VKNSEENILDNLVIAAPCSIPWEAMKGDDRQRDCSGCAKTVYNISDMTKAEAERFLKERGTSECMRFYRRTDGTIMTDNCPRALRKIREHYRIAVRAVAGVVALMLAVPAAFAQNRSQAVLLGKPARQTQLTEQQIRHLSAAGGPFIIRPQQLGTLTQTPSTLPPVTSDIQATLLTRVVTLPDGRRVTLVVPSRGGNVIWVRNSDGLSLANSERVPTTQFNTPAGSDKVETQALQFYIKAQDLRHQGNLALSEFYLEKALASFDLQKNQSDSKFRNIIEADLKSLREQIEIQSGVAKSPSAPASDEQFLDEPGDSAVPAELGDNAVPAELEASQH